MTERRTRGRSLTNGAITRIEVSTRRDGKISRIEHYSGGRIAAAEEDTDGDGRMDRWETYEDGRLGMVAFDTQRGGKPDRRIVYGRAGAVRVEADAKGDGTFAEPTAK